MPHNSTVVGNAIKASSVGIATSGGGISLGVIQISHDMIALAVVGLVVSLLAFGFDYHHSDKKVSIMATATSAAQYTIFGMFALPAGFTATKTYITSDVMTCMLGGVFASWTIVAVVKAIKTRGIKAIEEKKL